MRMLLALIVALVGFQSSIARAEWRLVRTDHFRLIIDESEQAARDFGTRLERFDAALRLLYGVKENPDQLARPITIYVLKDRLFYETCRCPGALGYYRPRTQGSYLLNLQMPELDRKAKVGGWSSQTVLLHEYSHHFTYFHFPIAYPHWFSEGFAEFNANATFADDGSVVLGYPANYRGQALKDADLSMRKLLDPHRHGYDRIDLFYGRGWLLTHLLILSPERKGQLATYLTAMNAGSGSVPAATRAFGSLDALDKQLDAYARGYLLAPLRIPAAKTTPSVTVTSLPPGQAEMLPSYLLFTDGIGKGYQLGPLMKARKIAARHPNDAVVQAQLAEAEFLANRLDAADQAADRALAVDPQLVDALVRKGSIAIARARAVKSTDPAVWKAARGWFLKANRLDPNSVPPMYLYHAAFVAEGRQPTADATRALRRAAALAPESRDVRMALARQTLLDGDVQEARAVLQPLAFAPHSMLRENVAQTILQLVEAGKIEEAKAKFSAAERE